MMTPRLQQVLDTIVELRDKRGIPPTIRELMSALGISSPNGMKFHLFRLRDLGLIDWTDNASRSIVVLNQQSVSVPLSKETHARLSKAAKKSGLTLSKFCAEKLEITP